MIQILNREPIKFYICIPVYQVEKYLEKCLDSILIQTYCNFDVILVNDGSTDNSGKICDKYSTIDERIHVIHQRNLGSFNSRINAQKAAKKMAVNDGSELKYFIYVDSDDYIRKNALEIIAKNIKLYKCDLLIFNMERIMNGKTISNYNCTTDFEGVIENKRELYNLVFRDYKYNSLCRKAVKFEIICDENYKDFYYIKHGEDLVQSIAIYKNCKKVVFIKDILYEYTLNFDSISMDRNGENYIIDSSVDDKVYHFLLEENDINYEDIQAYLEFMKKELFNQIKLISKFEISNVLKEDLLSKISKDTFYGWLINEGRLRNPILILMKYRCYTAVLLSVKIGYSLKNILNLVSQRLMK